MKQIDKLYLKVIDICIKNQDFDSLIFFVDSLCSKYEFEIERLNHTVNELYLNIEELEKLL